MPGLLKIVGKAPLTLGVHEGRLAPCPEAPNCVNSQYGGDSPGDVAAHHVPPFAFEGDPYEAMTRLVAVLLSRPEARIVRQTRAYLHVEFERRLFGIIGLVDDTEFLLDAEAQVIHLRAASRLGFLDFDANRSRIEELRVAFDEADDQDGSSLPES